MSNYRKSGLLSRSTFQALGEASFELFENLMLNIKRRSGDLISFRLASDVSAKMTSELLSQVYGQINPDILGGDYRDLQIALHYGLRLVGYAGNASLAIVRHLVEHYPSHDFVIDDEEVASLFYNVEPPNKELYAVIDLLGDSAYNEDSSGIARALSEHEGLPKENTDENTNDESENISSREEPTGLDDDRQEDRHVDPAAPGDPQTGG